MKHSFLSVCLLSCLLPFAAMAAESAVVSPETAAEKPAGALPAELRAAAEAAAARGAAYLAGIQQEDGHWSSPDTPALTALAFWALLETDSAAYAEAIDRAAAFVLRFAHADGAIFCEPAPGQFGGGLANYNTAVCMMALFALGRGELVPLIQQARRYVASTQNLGGSVYRGGMGYDPATGREYADLSNSYLSYEAMKATEAVEDLRAEGEAKADLDWDAVQEFLAQVQNLPGVNPQPWAGAEADDVGGFVYTPAAGGRPAGGGGEGRPAAPPARDGAKPPAAAKPGERPAPPQGARPVRLDSFGSMTYAGLLSLIYAKVTPEDPRVEAATEWARRHWTLEENPGRGPEGLYYFYNIMVKCLDTVGGETFAVPSGRTVAWRKEAVEKLLSLQREDGSWANAANRFWEGDPALVTAYCVLTLQKALGRW